jgi:hypothetical protein
MEKFVGHVTRYAYTILALKPLQEYVQIIWEYSIKMELRDTDYDDFN